ncbi:MAG: DNA polymerase III subunit beta [Leptospiraceae bacterium]|nr:DNA polymerase III subunit beta [Leptospiraceae bacterium]MCB1200295.1 DNA polymerase III subunit beta [Leptospiraceae bacterium]
MKFKARKDALEKALSRIEMIVPSKDMQALLSNILLTIEKEHVSVTASDMESTVRVQVPAEQTEPGELIMRARKVSEIARSIKSDEFIFSAEKMESVEGGETHFEVKVEGSGRSAARFKMAASDRSSYPTLNLIPEDNLASLPTGILAEMLRKTIYAISQEDNRYIYNGICFQSNGNKIVLVGTDGRRLSAITRELPSPVSLNEEGHDIVVHAKAIRELQKLLDFSEEAFVGVQQRDIFFRIGDAELSSRLLEGKFPDYKKVIPVSEPIRIAVGREVLLDSLNQVKVMSEPPSHQVRLRIHEGSMTLRAHTPELGEAESSFPIEYDGEELEIAFNALYMLDILRSLDSTTITLGLNDAQKPVVIRDNEDPDFIALVMPMKL